MRKRFTVFLTIFALLLFSAIAAAQDDTLDDLRDYLLGGQSESGSTDSEPDAPAQPAADALTNYSGGYQAVIAELVDLGIIPDSGALVFQEDRVFANAAGSGYVSLATGSPFPDVVMAGEIDFSSNSSEFESCGLTSRMTGTTNRLDQFLTVSVSNQGFGYVLDSQLPDDEGFAGFGDLTFNIDSPNHILYIVQGGEVSVYLDGELVLSGFEVTDRSGFYGLGMISDPSSVTNCEASNVWVYRIAAEAGGCEILAGGNVNLRGGPGTTFNVAGTLSGGSVSVAVAAATGADGFTWYQLEGGAYVREDVITAQGACASLPEPE
ncbi:MAG: hypothetical protein AAFU54_24300 [Chloroflexota bacterium]